MKPLFRTIALLGILTASISGQPANKAVPAPADVAAPPADALTTGSGLSSRILEAGNDDRRPVPDDLVAVHFTSWSTDGTMHQTTSGRDPVWAPVAALIPGWREGIQLMSVGERRRFWIPESLAYAGAEGKPAGMMVFDVELLDAINPHIAPPDVAEPPADAEVTPSGLASKILREGTGSTGPRGSQEVTVHYTGWTTEGVMFDSSYLRGEPSSFRLTGVIRGWTEGLKLMVPGEKRRFWIPSKLAYRGERGKPQGMLVFDVELISFR